MTNAPEFRVEPLVNPVKMPDRVTAALLALIRNGDYPARSRLPSEMEMAKRFGVSRTVIREAVSRLKSEGLVESRQGSGVFVRETSLDTPFRIDPAVVDSIRTVLQIVELRRGLESEIAALAAERCDKRQIAEIRAALQAIESDVQAGRDGVDADMEFHRSIARATNNPHFLALWDFIGQFLKGAMTITRALEARKKGNGAAGSGRASCIGRCDSPQGSGCRTGIGPSSYGNGGPKNQYRGSEFSEIRGQTGQNRKMICD